MLSYRLHYSETMPPNSCVQVACLSLIPDRLRGEEGKQAENVNQSQEHCITGAKWRKTPRSTTPPSLNATVTHAQLSLQGPGEPES